MDLQTTLITIIAFSAVLTVLSVIFSWLLNPVKENQVRMEEDLKQFKKEVNAKLDQLISQQSKQ